jgi:hypothetical protein
VTDLVTRTALFGVRFWDGVTGHAIADGLTLTDVGSGRVATVSPSGVFVLHDLPGLSASADGAGDEAFWAAPPVQRELALELRDSRAQFGSFRFAADAPHRGLFADACAGASPPDGAVGSVPLYSSATRTAPAGIAAVRADLWDAAADAPAAWAVLEVATSGGFAGRGLAGADGRCAVLFAYPEPDPQLSSPPSGGGGLAQQTWTVSVTVHYEPGGPGLPAPSAATAPDLCAALGQAAGIALASSSPPTPLGDQTLTFAAELVLRSPGQSVLLVLAA